MNPADKDALRLTGNDDVDHMLHGSEHYGSLAALLSGAFHPEFESPLNVAEGALEQLAVDLCVFSEVLASGTSLVPDILGNYARGLSHRATMAAEASKRIREANRAEPTMQARAAE